MDMTVRPETAGSPPATGTHETLRRRLSSRNSFTVGFVTITPWYQVIIWDTSSTASCAVAFVWDVRAVHCVRGSKLSMCAGAVAARCAEWLFPGSGGADVHLPNVQLNEWGCTSAPTI